MMMNSSKISIFERLLSKKPPSMPIFLQPALQAGSDTISISSSSSSLFVQTETTKTTTEVDLVRIPNYAAAEKDDIVDVDDDDCVAVEMCQDPQGGFISPLESQALDSERPRNDKRQQEENSVLSGLHPVFDWIREHGHLPAATFGKTKERRTQHMFYKRISDAQKLVKISPTFASSQEGKELERLTLQYPTKQNLLKQTDLLTKTVEFVEKHGRLPSPSDDCCLYYCSRHIRAGRYCTRIAELKRMTDVLGIEKVFSGRLVEQIKELGCDAAFQQASEKHNCKCKQVRKRNRGIFFCVCNLSLFICLN